jgi:hypothetical protein
MKVCEFISQIQYMKQILVVALTYGHFVTVLDLRSRSHHMVCDVTHYLCAAIEVAQHMLTRVEVSKEVMGKLSRKWLPTTDPRL